MLVLPEPWRRWFADVQMIFPDAQTAVVLCAADQLACWDLEVARAVFIVLRAGHPDLRAVHAFPAQSYHAMKRGHADLVQALPAARWHR